MDINQLSGALRNGLAVVQALAPLAALGGPTAAGAASIAATLADIGQNLLDKVEDGSIVATSDDAATVKGLLAEIRAENDQLAQRIAAS